MLTRFAIAAILLFALLISACDSQPEPQQKAETPQQENLDTNKAKRELMVEQQIATRRIKDASVLAAMRKVPRHEFVPDKMKQYAYIDSPLPIGNKQTISQPYIVALMTSTLVLSGTEKILEIGTGSGYQAAVLAEIVPEVYTIEIVEELGKRAQKDLKRLKYDNVFVKIGDGYQGWPEHAPFDAIIITAAPERIPGPLLDQLAVGGRLVVPLGNQDTYQMLTRITRTKHSYEEESITYVRFVPMTGESEKQPSPK
jgi:protein-L-isoaspartate(D-aspartate) O-methyltransferase